MSRKKKQLLNSSSALLYQILLMLYSFVVPRLYLEFYGSKINGLVASINSFLGIITFMDLGIGAVIQSNLYKPLADHDTDSLSKIYKSARKFFVRIVIGYLIYLVIYLVIYSGLQTDFDKGFTASLIIILAVNLIVEYLFGIVNQCVLIADQKGYIVQLISSVLILIIIVVNMAMIKSGCSIHMVRLAYSLIISLKPFCVWLYVRKRYEINYEIKYKEEPIKQKWNGVAQHIASYVTTSTDTLILTIFSTLSNVSVYYVYNLAVNGIKQVISALMNGFEALFGNMLANNEQEYLSKKFYELEWLSHTVIVFLFSCTAALIRDFVLMYTSVSNDASYDQELFGIIMSLAIALWCIRTTYYAIVKAAGHYKQTQLSSIIEMALNLSISIIVVFRFGLFGVAIGTLIAMMYRTTYLACYISKIISYSVGSYFKHIIIDALVFGSTIIFGSIVSIQEFTLILWLKKAVLVGLFCGILEVLLNGVFYKTHLINFIRKIRGL